MQTIEVIALCILIVLIYWLVLGVQNVKNVTGFYIFILLPVSAILGMMYAYLFRKSPLMASIIGMIALAIFVVTYLVLTHED